MSDPRPDLAEIRAKYQVADDELVTYRPRAYGAIDIPFTEGREMTRTEGELLDRLTRDRGLLGLSGFRDIAQDAFAEGTRRYPDNAVPASVPDERAREWQGNDGHRDAFRHAYWSARLAQEYGPEWARAFTTAHEGVPGNWADREAMDLYNNSVGIGIGASHRDASPQELAGLVQRAVQEGKLVVVDREGQLAWSDQVRIGQHGLSSDEVIGPQLRTPGAVSTESRAALGAPDTAPGQDGRGDTQLAAAPAEDPAAGSRALVDRLADSLRRDGGAGFAEALREAQGSEYGQRFEERASAALDALREQPAEQAQAQQQAAARG